MDRKAWFIDFAKVAGRKNLNAYAIGVIKSILCCDCNDPAKQVAEIHNATESLVEVFNDESLPWDVMDVKKASAPTETVEEISHLDCTIDVSKVEPLVDLVWAEEIILNGCHPDDRYSDENQGRRVS
ncbi:hypothetical protein [Desulfosporosinus nitroreducens]|uniref:hypothetical protein n=1 Tax=Desulfosporosinus nitroreducens TaxID=2018668 RepID=UPI00207CA980|nr:hypothetical protein [Desulfosporosinus nitroreducens]MCO1599781.1 hypothetical protein [Desulfosporosinus nitroreducens]